MTLDSNTYNERIRFKLRPALGAALRDLPRVRDHMWPMSDETPSEILGSLPRTRPHRRSGKRGGPADGAGGPGAESEPTAGKASAAAPSRPKTASRARPKAHRRAPQRRARPEPLRQPKQPAGTPPPPGPRRPIPPSGTELLSTLVQATGELAEIGLSLGARAVRNAIGRLPRP